MNAVPVITLCAAPDWMKGGQPGETDWSQIEVAPRPEHYHDFAELAKLVAQRYPDVKHYQVWNEMKGFWNSESNNWDYVNYTRMYNMVYDALKSVSADIKVGGPYLVIEGTGSSRGGWASEVPIRERQWKVIDYWLKDKHGADFIVLDRGIKDYHDKNTYAMEELMELTPYFGDIVRQIRSRTDLPIWWAEYYAHGDSPEAVAAIHASVLNHMISSGSSAAFLWQPMKAGKLNHALFSDVRKPGGIEIYPYYHVFRAIHEHFRPGTQLYRATSSSNGVEVLASATKFLLINKRPEPIKVLVNGKSVDLDCYEVRMLDL
jgi:hypothetical protein